MMRLVWSIGHSTSRVEFSLLQDADAISLVVPHCVLSATETESLSEWLRTALPHARTEVARFLFERENRRAEAQIEDDDDAVQ